MTIARILTLAVFAAVLAGCGDVLPPAALNAVKSQQVGGGCCTALEFVEVHHVQAVVRPWVIIWPFCGSECGAQAKSADAAHAIDAYSHDHTISDAKGSA